MRAFAATQFTLTRFGIWRWAVLCLGVLVAMIIGAWFVTQPQRWRAAPVPWALFVIVLTGWLLAVQPRTTPLSLRWDGQRWHVGPADSAGHEPWAGELQVAIDLGAWMLLRFVPDADVHGCAVTWLPVQRRGLAAQWHALRCAVYSPRPAAGVDAAPDV
jgi:hypothetical protein